MRFGLNIPSGPGHVPKGPVVRALVQGQGFSVDTTARSAFASTRPGSALAFPNIAVADSLEGSAREKSCFLCFRILSPL